jgi:hypothetical protein
VRASFRGGERLEAVVARFEELAREKRRGREAG